MLTLGELLVMPFEASMSGRGVGAEMIEVIFDSSTIRFEVIASALPSKSLKVPGISIDST
jgi:hypothetical protein